MPQQGTHTSLSALSLSSCSDLNIGEQYCAHLHLHNRLAANSLHNEKQITFISKKTVYSACLSHTVSIYPECLEYRACQLSCIGMFYAKFEHRPCKEKRINFQACECCSDCIVLLKGSMGGKSDNPNRAELPGGAVCW